MDPILCLAFVCFPVAFIASIKLRDVTIRRLRNTAACRLCGYSRAGLPEGVVCPECGATSAEVLAPPRPRRMLVLYAILPALPALATITCWTLVPDMGAAGVSLLTWAIAGAGVAWPLRIAESQLRPERAMILMSATLLPVIASLLFALGQAIRLGFGCQPPSEYGRNFDVTIVIGIAGPLLAINAGNWSCLIACAVIGVTTKDPAKPMRSPERRTPPVP